MPRAGYSIQDVQDRSRAADQELNSLPPEARTSSVFIHEAADFDTELMILYSSGRVACISSGVNASSSWGNTSHSAVSLMQ